MKAKKMKKESNLARLHDIIPSTSLPRSFTLNSSATTTATRERCRFASDYSRGGCDSCMVMGRIDEEKACDMFEEEDLLFDQFKKRKFDRVFSVC
ncbi:hypothetical protein N665_0499s0011 [Sinapis alba]|nr:hypothetical protein N665_0499s0011 [Sinapis alba]